MNLPLAAASIAAVLILGAAFWMSSTGIGGMVEGEDDVGQAGAGGDTVAVSIAEGETVEQISEKLEAAGVIDSALRFQIIVALTGRAAALLSGDHELPTGITAQEAVSALTTAPVDDTTTLTVPEGWRREEIADLVQELGIAARDEFLAASSSFDYDYGFLADIPDGTASLEGYLFPDTYFIAEDATAGDVVALMLGNFDSRVTQEARAGFEAQGLSLHQAITLASIIEREAVVAEERPTIAGVFYNRIAAGDILGADPTVQYVLGSFPESVAQFGYWKVGLTTGDIDFAVSPYNTYQNAGLPPAPIAQPGLASIEAAAFPQETDFYYFYACGEDGVHTFSVTGAEHEAAQAACVQ
ncbi:MAG: endolytic transglycosylase MltG [Dehalococcoidia bacterium]|nr:endolytic transglycosylase MltG [Dehalococcoidia bacterium]